MAAGDTGRFVGLTPGPAASAVPYRPHRHRAGCHSCADPQLVANRRRRRTPCSTAPIVTSIARPRKKPAKA